VTSGIRTVIYPVKDIAKAKALYGKLLGVAPYADSPYYVGFKVADQDIGLSPAPYGQSEGTTGPISFLHVDDIRASLQLILDAGGKEQQPVKDVGGGRLVASATDAEGNVIGLIQNP
jgi:predicted enzyme related to lactoylglutathione lyase